MNNTVNAWLINNVPLTESNKITGPLKLKFADDDYVHVLPYIADCNSTQKNTMIKLHPGRINYTIYDGNNDIIRKDDAVEINEDNDNILVLQGRSDYPDSLDLINYSGNAICPINGEANVTFIHSAALVPSVNIEISGNNNRGGGTAGYASVEKSFSERYQHHTQERIVYTRSNNIKTGSKTIRITNSNNGQEIVRPLSVNLDTGNYYLIMSGAPLSHSNYQGASATPCVILIKADCKSQMQTTSRHSKWQKISRNIYIGH
jgi:hypothetical protein